MVDTSQRWSNGHDPLGHGNSVVGVPYGIPDMNQVQPQGDDRILAKLSIATTEDKTISGPTPHANLRDLSPVNVERESDTGSVHSMPVAHVTEPSRSWRPSSGFVESPTSATPAAPRTPSTRSRPSTMEPSLNIQDGRSRHRSTTDGRSSNRFSGFINNLIHRRDVGPVNHSRNLTREERSRSLTPGPASAAPPRPSSPIKVATTSPPPPPLSPPTLQELGLSFSVLTSDLSPSHFSTPPWSGTFLRPHYLLLCHAQGLDVLPLVSPLAPQPYALVRRVSFKSVVVMEQRGVLVAIAGRRSGIRVYALEEVKKAIEWRIEFEERRERERKRREAAKKVITLSPYEHHHNSLDTRSKSRSSATIPATSKRLPYKPNHASPALASPRPQSVKKVKPSHPPPIPETSCTPPPYTSRTDLHSRTNEGFTPEGHSRPRRPSVSNLLAGPSVATSHSEKDVDTKAEWEEESSDDEAINIVAAGASGSQALDERTSAIHRTSHANPPLAISESRPTLGHSQTSAPVRRNRPGNLTLSRSATNPSRPPSPTPTLRTLRQTLSQSPGQTSRHDLETEVPTNNAEIGDEGNRITLAQALMESRLPDLPPIGTRRPQQPILIVPNGAADNVASPTPRTSDDEDEDEEGGVSLTDILMESRLPHLPPAGTRQPQQPILIIPTAVDAVDSTLRRGSDANSSASSPSVSERNRTRRRWSVLDGMFPNSTTVESPPPLSPNSPPESSPSAHNTSRDRAGASLSRSHSDRLASSSSADISPRTSSPVESRILPSASIPPRSSHPDIILPSQRSGLIPRIISKALHARRSDEQYQTLVLKATDDDNPRAATHSSPPPKLDYVKLPGTKGAVMVRAVETPKKSFLAILCGENGEKVELFAGTYRTALGLSRTFILPDSPRSLELQLQGDDLVEVFLVFSQNVFGLEPATVRVREVRIGRDERRAARRRARQSRQGEFTNDAEDQAGDEDTNVNFNVGVTVSVAPGTATANDGDQPSNVPSPEPEVSTTPGGEGPTVTMPSDELVTLASAQMGPYTTFQQLSFAPKFPLASIADGYIIPPTYAEFLEYRGKHEPEGSGGNPERLQIQLSPPGLPLPANTPPSKWLYRDPKGVVHGPWKASLMQSWYKEGLLPPDLPVRQEGETEFTLLKDLRLQCVDPTHPFRSPPPPPSTLPPPAPLDLTSKSEKPLLRPISLLAQPPHFGPPALFFSSRGGHSTAIVDAKGRSVLKGRFLWSSEADDESKPTTGRMGDVKRLEALDVKDRAILVAMRQGGLEVVDFGDALLRPADESRVVLPQFNSATSNTSRRGPFVWKIGTPVFSSPTSSTVLSSKSKGNTFLPSKKQSAGLSRSPLGKTEFTMDGEDGHDEVLFLGRKDDEIYLCERNAGSFRILRLCPS